MLIKNVTKQLISFILPITTLIIVPFYIVENFNIRFTIITIIGFLLLVSGLFVLILTISTFIRIGRGTLAPWSPTRKLITGGIYGYVRNPMIIGVITALIGESFVLLSFNIIIWAVMFFFINTVYFILYEEPSLEKRFGKEYMEYKRDVPRWIPRSKPFIPKKK